MIDQLSPLFQFAEEFDKIRTNLHLSYIGSIPSMDGDWKTWAKDTGENPFPIQYTLSPVRLISFYPTAMVTKTSAKYYKWTFVVV